MRNESNKCLYIELRRIERPAFSSRIKWAASACDRRTASSSATSLVSDSWTRSSNPRTLCCNNVSASSNLDRHLISRPCNFCSSSLMSAGAVQELATNQRQQILFRSSYIFYLFFHSTHLDSADLPAHLPGTPCLPATKRSGASEVHVLHR